jgi:hypothetical protein
MVRAALALLLLSVACRREPSQYSPGYKDTTTSVEGATTTLNELKQRVPFDAMVVDAFTKQSREDVSARLRPREEWVTNAYMLKLRDLAGRIDIVAGVNAAEEDVQGISKLEKGRVYRFPSVIVVRPK